MMESQFKTALDRSPNAKYVYAVKLDWLQTGQSINN